MKKLIATLAMVFLFVGGAIAQDSKVALIYSQEVVVLMSEYKEMQQKITDLQEVHRKDLQQMEEEFKKKYADFAAEQETLTENIKTRKMAELQDLDTRLQNAFQVAQEDIEKQSQELYMGVMDKLRAAIKAVGDEKGYTYIVDAASLLYIGKNMEDATPAVKTKLGL